MGQFASAAEAECAKLFDYYGIPWEYEPRTFVLEEDEEGRTVEAFTPDFYLPEQDLYVELTVMKLFYKRDLERLAQHFHLDLAS